MANQGTGDVTALVTASGITFWETTATGNVNLTTVFATYKKGTREFPCVHSRHMMILGNPNPLPSQYHGTCTVPK